MLETETIPVDVAAIRSILDPEKPRMKLWLKICAHCSLCAESCFLYTTRGRAPEYVPAYKFIHSVGTLYRKNGRVNRQTLETIGDIVWNRCVLCTRCYCPFGIDIPEMIALGRKICRSQDIYRQYDKK